MAGNAAGRAVMAARRELELTVALLLARTVWDGDCLLWLGNCSRGNDPQVRLAGRQVSVRRTLYAQMHGRPPRANLLLSSRQNGAPCDGRCVCPDHLTARSHEKAHTGARMPPGHRHNSARAKQTASRLNWQIVREIRASTEPSTDWAARLGVTKQHICLIRQHKTWLDLAHPFAGLLDAVGR